ncbi:hypothetical protein BD311DRAFT_757411, partial [Dichomitus squalens]
LVHPQHYHVMLIDLSRSLLLVVAIGATHVCLAAEILHARQTSLCSALLCALVSQDCGDGCECKPLLGGVVGGLCGASPSNSSAVCSSSEECLVGTTCTNNRCVPDS